MVFAASRAVEGYPWVVRVPTLTETVPFPSHEIQVFAKGSKGHRKELATRV